MIEAKLDRRSLLQVSAALVASSGLATGLAGPANAAEPKIVAEEHWAQKGDVKLYLYRKRMVTGDAAKDAAKPVLFLVHGSTFAGRGSFDLQVPGRTGYSGMDHFAGLGYDVWTMDHEDYGFSSRTGGNSGILTGVADLKAAIPMVEKVTGKSSVMMFGPSSGAIRAGAFAAAEPKRVSRLIMHAYTHTGIGAPEIERRKKQIEVYKANPRRPFGKPQIESIFNRDVAGRADPVLVKALADFELQFGDSVPSGSYLDMAMNMPMVDPAKLTCGVCLIRPEHDGNATEEELHAFFQAIASKEKQFIMVSGMTHGGGMVGQQRHRLWHIMQQFLTMPPPPVA
jgi:alpha-beta hydrolase superfamily lysophospholipase